MNKENELQYYLSVSPNKYGIYLFDTKNLINLYKEEIILNNGGSVSSSISKKTSYLVLGSKPGSKYDKAKNLKVKIIDEKNFSKLL